jgi:hypothetical protein
MQERLVELGEKIEYSAKLYNMLALVLVWTGKHSNADKIFKKSLTELKILEEIT